MINLILVDDHLLFCQGIEMLLDKASDMQLMATIHREEDLLTYLQQQLPDIVLMDISLGMNQNGIRLTEQLQKIYPDIKVIALSMHQDANTVSKMLKAGVQAFVHKSDNKDAFIQAIRLVKQGEAYFSPAISAAIATHFKQENNKQELAEKPMLTKRETQILRLLAEGQSNTEIATQLFISVRTVEAHRYNLIEKLQAKNNVGLVHYAIRNGLIEIKTK